MTRHSPVLVLTVAALACASGCSSPERTLDAAEKTVASPTGKTVIGIAASKDPEAALRKRLESYEQNPEEAIRDIRAAQRDFQTVMDALRGKATKAWGKKEVRLPDRTRYVKYTQNYKSRAVVDFDKGEVLVETLDDRNPKGSLKRAIVTTLLTPDDPRSVDLFSDKQITLTGEKDPYLLGLVVDQNGKAIRTPDNAEQFADYLMEKRIARRTVKVERASKTALAVRIAMVSNHANKQAQKYEATVNRFAQQYKVSRSLVFAIIRTESNFNPFAVSAVPAYGLMQLVPTSGGREGYRKAKGQDTVPSRDYLFDPNNNIELGAALLNVLTYHQLDPVENTVSREYCVISAYNTGVRNVLRTFSKDSVIAVNQINGLQPPSVYEKLRQHLPYEETRQYLVRVTTYRKDFASTAESAGQ